MLSDVQCRLLKNPADKVFSKKSKNISALREEGHNSNPCFKAQLSQRTGENRKGKKWILSGSYHPSAFK